jgi:hypothetical protein
MSLSHAQTTAAISTSKLFTELSDSMKLLCKKTKDEAFATLEIELHQKFAEAERQCMAKLLEQYDWDYPSFISDDKSFKRSSRNNKIYITLAGEVTLERTLYRTVRNGSTYCPMELNAGLVEGFWTPQAAKQALHLVSLNTPSECEQIFKEFGLMSPSKSSLDRLPKKLNEHWETNRLTLEKKLFDVFEIPSKATICAISLDGVMISTRYAQVLPGDSRWCEACCGTVSFFDKEGELLCTRFLARMPEHKKKTLKSQLAMQFEQIKKLRPDLKMIKIADGARDNWTFLNDEIKEGECVLDFYHASTHIHNAMEIIYGKNSVEAITEHKKYRHILRHDEKGIDKIICHLKYQLRKNPQKEKIKTEVTYFSRNRERCHYARLAIEKKPIGSGIVESACKTVLQMRCKRSGQRWEDKGGQAILTFRSILLSKQLDDAWKLIKNIYHQPIEPPKNVVQLRRI